ncbi:hypothetical protein M9H77_33157 [Catharanthus roseus]|uniref:Uncharacterized protein n=1 Tax=Catharanthus roseus TaxID=4058 RepID=A0ACB9ZHX4_CATRO|nr:hypothetical protein M9H77_33157 [Catharanthus roseus]
MSPPANVRLLRCPKCENLLPELTDYTVYQCAACDTVLRAMGRNGEFDVLSEKSDEERIGGVLERFSQGSEEKRMRNLSDASEDDVKSSKDGSFGRDRERRRFFNDGIENFGTSSVGSRAGKRIVQDSNGMIDSTSTNEISYAKREKEFVNIKPQIGNGMGLHRSQEVQDWRIRESEIEAFRRAQRIDEVGMGYATLKRPEEGRLNYQLHGGYSYGEPLQRRTETMGFDQVAYPGESQAELLRKLDELKDKLSRSCELDDKAQDKVALDRRMFPQDPYVYSAMSKPSMPYSFPDKQAARPSYTDHYLEPSSSIDRHARVGYGYYPPTHTSGHVHEFEDPLGPQLLRRHPSQASAHYQQKPYHAHFSGPFRDGNIVPVDPFESYSPTVNHHHPSCSRISDGAKDPAFYHHENPNEYNPRDHSAKISDFPSFQSHSSQSHARLPDDLNSEVGGFVHRRPSRMLVAHAGRRCLPIAGAAPFLTCQNCFELLQLPKRLFANNTKEKKIRCGACAALIILVADNKRLHVTVRVDVSSDAEENVINEKDHLKHDGNLSEGSSYAHIHPNRASMNFSSEDYDNSGYDFQAMDRELGSISTGQRSLNESGDIRDSSSSDEEDNVERSPAAVKDSQPVDLPVEKASPAPPAGSSLQECFEYSNKYHVVNRLGDGSRNGHSEQEKAAPKKITLREDSMKDGSATEIEISTNEYLPNTGTSLDSGEVNKEGSNKTSDSIFAGIMKQSFGNKSNSNIEQEKANVTVNGNLIPGRLIEKAEKLAGPIHPGNYWYDFRAGFWGVMGGPCLGIIPPFIEEFNYPIAANCSGGKTGIFVNGRELHRKDLNLLANRGLPTERDRSYIVEISGRVLDEYTGEELDSLGKLAPTIERMKRGFGMKGPKQWHG